VLKEDADYFIAHGANDVIHKPLNVSELNSALAKLSV
jgi:CheY-like chemotaxis protein